jgi:gas vesicle protein
VAAPVYQLRNIYFHHRPIVDSNRCSNQCIVNYTERTAKMKPNHEFKFPYLLAGIGLGAISGLLLALRMSEDTRKYLRERGNKSREYLNQRAKKLRESAEAMVEKGKKIVSRRSDSVDTATEAERQEYEEKKRDNLGG